MDPRAVAERPRAALLAAGRAYPGLWRAIEGVRAGRGRDVPAWPAWCYVPSGALAACLVGGGSKRSLLLTRLGALAAWRPTQGVYLYDATLAAALDSTPLDGDLPAAILERLPEWCPYLATPGMRVAGRPLYGCWARLDWHAGRRERLLQIVLDLEGPEPDGTPGPLHLPIPLLLEARTLDAAVDHLAHQARRQTETFRAATLAVVRPIVSRLLYLCSAEAEIAGGTGRPVPPAPVRTKRGMRIFAPSAPRVWEVGVRLGAALRQAAARERAAHAAGTHASPRPHIRRAHWHGFWSGPRDGPRTLGVRWLPPIPINVRDLDALPSTVRPVR